MTTHIFLRVGTGDASSAPAVSSPDTCLELSLGRPGERADIHTTALQECARYGFIVPPACMDLLHLAQAVYCADLGVLRSTGHESWTRDLALHLPVMRRDLWEAVRPVAEDMLSFLSGDHWVLHLRDLAATSVQMPTVKKVVELGNRPNAVSLFSGGMDSFIGAIDRLESGEPTAFVGHHGAGTTNKAQQNVFPILEKHYPGLAILLPFFVQQPKSIGSATEKTTRSRSILFLALGTVVAAALGPSTPLLIPENGLISINRPLTYWRMGSCATRTTHPHFIGLFRRLLEGLGIGVDVQMPYRFHTKGEMARGVLGSEAFKSGWVKTISCSHPEVGRYRKKSPGQHCGYCVPCIIRRASLAAVGLDDPGHYLEDVLGADQTWATSRSDLRCFHMAVEQFDEDSRRRHLFDVLETGPIPPGDAALHADVYRRGMVEVHNFLREQIGAPA
jgi:hypothetical protein